MSGYEEEHSIPKASQSQPRRPRTDFSTFFAFRESIDTTNTRTLPEVSDVRSAYAMVANGYRAMLGDTEGITTEHQDSEEITSNPLILSMIQELSGDLEEGMLPKEVKGMPDEFFSELERIPKKDLKPDMSCPLCLNTFLDDPYPLVVRLPCHKSHMFDLECIQPWLTTKTTCPIDRKDFAAKQPPPVKKPAEDDEEEEWNDMYA